MNKIINKPLVVLVNSWWARQDSNLGPIHYESPEKIIIIVENTN